MIITRDFITIFKKVCVTPITLLHSQSELHLEHCGTLFLNYLDATNLDLESEENEDFLGRIEDQFLQPLLFNQDQENFDFWSIIDILPKEEWLNPEFILLHDAASIKALKETPRGIHTSP